MPLDVIVAIGEIARKVKRLLEDRPPYTDFLLPPDDVEKARKIMVVGASEAFKTRVEYYAAQSAFCPAWLDEAADETVWETLTWPSLQYTKSPRYLESVPSIVEDLRKGLHSQIDERIKGIGEGRVSLPPQRIAEGDLLTDFWNLRKREFLQLREDCERRIFAVWTAQPPPGGWRLDYWNKKETSGFKKRFESLAQKAAAKLGSTAVEFAAVSFWLDQIKRDWPESVNTGCLIHDSDGKGQLYSLDMVDVCYWSAYYCDKCAADQIRTGAYPSDTGARISMTSPPPPGSVFNLEPRILAANPFPENDPRHDALEPIFEVMKKFHVLEEEYPALSINWRAEDGRWLPWPPPLRAIGDGERCPSAPGSDLHLKASAGEAATLLPESPESWFNPGRDPWLDIGSKEPWECWFYAIREYWLNAGADAEDSGADIAEFERIATERGYRHTNSGTAVGERLWRKMVKGKKSKRELVEELELSTGDEIGQYEQPAGWLRDGSIENVFKACEFFCGVLAARRAQELENIAAASPADQDSHSEANQGQGQIQFVALPIPLPMDSPPAGSLLSQPIILKLVAEHPEAQPHVSYYAHLEKAVAEAELAHRKLAPLENWLEWSGVHPWDEKPGMEATCPWWVAGAEYEYHLAAAWRKHYPAKPERIRELLPAQLKLIAESVYTVKVFLFDLVNAKHPTGPDLLPETHVDRFADFAFLFAMSKFAEMDSREWEQRVAQTTRDISTVLTRAGKRPRGRRPDKGRRDAIRNAITKHGESWRDHLPDIFAELDTHDVDLGDFQSMKIDLGDGQSRRAMSWDDLELAVNDQRRKLIDALRQYLK